ncbi:hypothetical protein MK489_17100 [Myxococcota bacterium]|nr:hypothetical protein [Myxococcota bacterium]
MNTQLRASGGWWITLATGLATFTALLGLFLQEGFDADALHAGVRWTARGALVSFWIVFVSSSARSLWSSATTRWLVANRRYLGVSFGIFMGFHLLMLIALGVLFPGPFFSQLDALTITGGGLAYAFTAAMVLTSSDRSVRRLGRARWFRLHRMGLWFNWAVFTFTYFGDIRAHPQQGWALTSLWIGAGLRWVTARTRSG